MNTPPLSGQETQFQRMGGIAALAIAVGYVAVIGLYAVAGATPVGGAAWLTYLAGKAEVWWGIVGVSVLTNLLYVPLALALYVTLRGLNRLVVWIGVAFIGLFVALELAVNWTCYAALIVLSRDYTAATTDAQRAILVAAASFPSAVIASPLALVYAVGTLSLGFLIIGVVMLRSTFGKAAAWVGIATGVLGLLAVAGVSMAVILNALAATVWLLLVGGRLARSPDLTPSIAAKSGA